MTDSTTLKRTPLYDEHVSLSARMVEFGGWEMPVQYEGILAEHLHTRNGVSIFDISHMGEFLIEGDAVASGIDRLFTMNITDMPLKTCRYGALCNDQGYVLDDLIVFRIEKEKWFIVVNASTTQKDFSHIKQNLTSEARITDLSSALGKIDIQGPQARDVLCRHVPEVSKLDFYTFDYFNVLDEHVIISRTGYTGELGYEIYFPWEKTVDLWRLLLNNKKVKPAGLGARDVLRLEVGYSLYGHELGESITPLEAGLTRFIDFQKEFIGKKALEKHSQGALRRKLIGFVSQSRRSPREGQILFDQDNNAVGKVTSGTFSPMLNKGIGLGFVDRPDLKREEKIYFGDEKNKNSAIISSKIFYTNGSLKN